LCPAFVIHFKLNSKNIDININPKKKEIKFNNPKKVSYFIFKSIKEILLNNNNHNNNKNSLIFIKEKKHII